MSRRSVLGIEVFRVYDESTPRLKPLRGLVFGLLGIADGLVSVISFGFLVTTWEISFAMWDLKRKSKKINEQRNKA